MAFSHIARVIRENVFACYESQFLIAHHCYKNSLNLKLKLKSKDWSLKQNSKLRPNFKSKLNANIKLKSDSKRDYYKQFQSEIWIKFNFDF